MCVCVCSLSEAVSLRIDPIVWSKFFKGSKYGNKKKKKKKKKRRLETKVRLGKGIGKG